MNDVVVNVGKTEFVLQNGTMRRYPGEAPDYLDVGVAENNNRILFYYSDASEIVDYIDTIIKNVPDIAVKYLDELFEKRTDILLRLWYTPGSEMSCFEVYHNCTCESNELDDLIRYMASNNDFAAAQYRYTEVINGKQRPIE